MQHLELPRALEDYFAFAEVAPTRDGRRFTITLPYLDGTKLDRLQWWWSLNPTQEKVLGEGTFEKMRAQAIERFSQHIQRWLLNNNRRFFGNGPIPELGMMAEALPTAAAAETTTELTADETTAPVVDGAITANIPQWKRRKLANG